MKNHRPAGLRLQQRWGGWNQAPFNAENWLHIVVYGR